jgi:hypothetical protein
MFLGLRLRAQQLQTCRFRVVEPSPDRLTRSAGLVHKAAHTNVHHEPQRQKHE